MICLHLPPRHVQPAYTLYKTTPTQCSSITIKPPTTNTQAARQARQALRQFRETLPTTTTGPIRLTVQLPIPSPSTKETDLITNFDEGDWPGGPQQLFRAMRPLIERFLEGYNPEFIGVASPSDGIGVWSACDGALTLIYGVNNATFSTFAKLCYGGYGSRVLNDNHMIIVVNPAWTTSKDIGQLWDRQLKEQAAELIDDDSTWRALYHWEDTRTATGASGLIFYPGGTGSSTDTGDTGESSSSCCWYVYDTWARDPSDPGDVVWKGEERPTDRATVIKVLNEAREVGKKEGREPVAGSGAWWRW